MDIAVQVKNVTKNYRMYAYKNSTLKEKIVNFKKESYSNKLVLNNVSLEIKKGETVGLIGRNGSGKSTLLKLISKIIYPDNGEIDIYGRVSSLLELGAGFHPDFTGRENIYMNASILGLAKLEIDEKLESIIAFSELEDYIDSPVKTYSSGMYMRLAFSVAISVDPEILLIDEVLAVGDNSFQNKCINKLRELKGLGKTIIIVSHDNSMMEKLCDKLYWLKNGEIISIGYPKEIIIRYLDDVSREENNRLISNEIVVNEEDSIIDDINQDIKNSIVSDNRWGNKKVEILDVLIRDKNGESKGIFKVNDSINIEIFYRANESYENIVFGIGIFSSEKINCYGTNTDIDKFDLNNIPTQGSIVFSVESLVLQPGVYSLDIAIHKDDGEPFDYISGKYNFTVYSDINDIGIVKINHEWKINSLRL